MSCAEKRSGAYMIRNKTNGKVYIGVTTNLQRRFTQYLYMNANYNPKNPDHARPISKAIHEEGWDNFEFIILEDDPKYLDDTYRAHREMELVMKYQSLNPAYGYNSTVGGDVTHSRRESKNSTSLKLTRFRNPPKFCALFMYDTKTGDTTYIPFGAKGLMEKFHQSEMTIRWSVRNAALVADRYYLFEVNKTRRTEIYEFAKATRLGERGFAAGGNAQRAVTAFRKYETAYEKVNKVAILHGQ